MLDARIRTWCPELKSSSDGQGVPGSSAQFLSHISLRQALNICPYNMLNWFPLSIFSGSTITERALLGTWGPLINSKTTSLSNVEKALSEYNIQAILERNITTRTTMVNTHSKTINADTLCNMIHNWQLADIYECRKYNITKKEIDTFVSPNFLLTTATNTVHLGSYNALLIAASVGNFELVKHFIEEKQADINIRGGLYGDLTLIDCVKRSRGFFSAHPNSQRIVTYLENKLQEKKQLLNTQISDLSIVDHQEKIDFVEERSILNNN